MNILMVAAENGAIPGGKVGGIGDVVRDIPAALAASGKHTVHVVTPGYQAFSKLPGARKVSDFQVDFAGQKETIEVYKVAAAARQKSITLWALEHPLFAVGGVGEIYCDDSSDRPFATDASKFALFSMAVAESILQDVYGSVEVLHLHDWHAAMVLVLRAYDPNYAALQEIHTVYTIHNLALQGVRPLTGDQSALEAWFPRLNYARERINDPRVPHCVNPMRAGINLSDKVHAVSPTYAREILLASDLEAGYFGGEGLEQDLQNAAGENRLHGILNGCEYPESPPVKFVLRHFFELCEEELLKWIGRKQSVDSAHVIAWHRLQKSAPAFESLTDPLLVTSVGRVTDQKVRLLMQPLDNGKTALEQLLSVLGDKGLFIMLGSGDQQLEQFLVKIASTNYNFIFLNGYSEALSQSLYDGGDLFLMPSSFEPCGISQMLAMRAGQPCLVHKVGGLSDTVIDGSNGFTFAGNTLRSQAENMLARFAQVLKIRKQKKWQKISRNAAEARFLWDDTAGEYLKLLYSN